VQFKPGLIDAAGNVFEESTRGFLQSFMDRFGELVGKVAPR